MLQFDADAVATEMDYKDAQSAKNRWNTIRRKKIAGTASSGGDNSTPKKRKGKADVADGDDDEETPKPKRKRGPTPKADKAKKEDGIKKEEMEEEANAVESTEKAEDDGADD